jgi:citronellol/citronellal dehydrogenase
MLRSAMTSGLQGRTIVMPGGSLATAAVINLFGDTVKRSRTLEIMADAAVQVLSRPSTEQTGQTLIDVDVLAAAGVTDLSPYGGGDAPDVDIFLDPA